MGRVTLTLAAAALAAAACGNRTTEPEPAGAGVTVQAGDTVRLRVGESARIEGSQVSVAFRGISEDSRCPIDALCVWAGDAVARVDVALARSAWQPRDLHLNVEPRTTEFNGYVLELVEVLPAPVSTRTTQPNEYSIGLAVTRR